MWILKASKQSYIFLSSEDFKFKVIRKEKYRYIPFKPSGYESRSLRVKILFISGLGLIPLNYYCFLGPYQKFINVAHMVMSKYQIHKLVY